MMSRQPPTRASRKRPAIGRCGHVAPHVARTGDSFQCQLDGIGGTFAIPLTYYSYPVGRMIRKNVRWRLGEQELMMMSRLRGRTGGSGESAGFAAPRASFHATRYGRANRRSRIENKTAKAAQDIIQITKNELNKKEGKQKTAVVTKTQFFL